jgi:hypothetical protein
VKYSGNGTVGATVGHGLSSAPEFTIIKKLDTVGYSGGNWVVGYGSYNTDLYLNNTGAAGTINYFWNSAPTSTVIEFKNDWFVNYNGSEYIMYNFHSVSGYSKIGSYSGTGSSGNAITGLGFEPNWLIVKRTDVSGNSWLIVDNKRVESNGNLSELFADTSSAESGSGYDIDFTSDGFTLNTTTSNANASGTNNYIYMAFK